MKIKTVEHINVQKPSLHIPSLAGAFDEPVRETLVLTVCSKNRVAKVVTWDTPINWVEIIEDVQEAMSGEGLTGILVFFTDQQRALSLLKKPVNEMLETLRVNGVWIKDAFLVQDNTYWSFMCEGCCSPEGTRFSPLRAAQEPVSLDAAELWERICNFQSSTDKEQDASLIGQAVQNVHVRDQILARSVQEEHQSELVIDALISCVSLADDELLPRLAGMNSALMAAFNYPNEEICLQLELAEDDSLGALVKRGIGSDVPAQLFKSVFTQAMTLTSTK